MKSRFKNQRFNPFLLLLVLIPLIIIGIYVVSHTHATNADINGDGKVDINDLSILASDWGKTGMTFAQGDINGDGKVNILDLSILAANWGATTSGLPQPVGLGQTNGPKGSWTKLDFDDEFSSSNSSTCDKACGLDGNKWRTGWDGGSAPVQSQELECYEPTNVQVINGYLRLFATNQSQSCPKGGTSTRPYTSGAVDSGPSRYGVTYGYAEARVKIDSDSSNNVYNWPAWWLTDGAHDSYTGEIDVMEGLSGTAAAHVHPSGASCGGQKMSAGWHTLGVDWEPGTVTMYYDGVSIGSCSYSVTTSHNLVLGEQISKFGDYGGTIKVPSEMDIDYVRVWKH